MAYAFASASSQYLETSSSPLSTYPLTIAAWAYSASPHVGIIASVNTNGGNARQQLVLTNVGSVVQMGSVDSAGASQSASSGATFSDGIWFHAAGIVSSATSRVAYLNGVAGTTLTSNIVTTGMDRVLVGARRNSSGVGAYLNGRVADVGIWNVALTAAEIASLANGVTCDHIRPESLIFYAPLVRDLVDKVGGMTITNNNTATVANHPRVYA